MEFTYSPFQSATTFAVTVASTAIALTNISTKYMDAVKALITVDTGSIRLGLGGYTPTSIAGHKYAVDSEIVLEGWEEMVKARFIGNAGTSATIWVTVKNPK